MGPVLGFEPQISGTNSYEETAGSDVVVVTAGLPRSPGMSRDDLVTTNEKIVQEVTEAVGAASPEAGVGVVSEPPRPVFPLAENLSRLPKEPRFRVAGLLRHAA